MLSDSWGTGQTGHTAEHNRISRRLNRGIFVETRTGVAIQNAIDAITSRGGDVNLLPGEYALSAQIVLPWHVNLVGVGYYATTLKATAPIQSMIRLSDPSFTGGSLVEGMRLNGNGAAACGIELDHTSNNEISKVWVEGCVDHGLFLHGGVWGNTIERCFFRGCTNGIHILNADSGNQANINTIRYCNPSSNRVVGISLVGGVGITIERCDIENNGQYGIIQSGGGTRLSIVRNYLERNGTEANPGVNIKIGSDAGSYHISPEIIGNYIFGGAQPGYTGESECAIEIANTLSPNIQSNRTWGHRNNSLRWVGSKNLDPVVLANVFNEPIGQSGNLREFSGA